MIVGMSSRAALRRETGTGHADDGSPVHAKVFVWKDMPCFYDKKKIDFQQGSTSARQETEYIIHLPWLKGDLLPRVSDVIIVDGIEHRVHEVNNTKLFFHHVEVTAYRVTRRGI